MLDFIKHFPVIEIRAGKYEIEIDDAGEQLQLGSLVIDRNQGPCVPHRYGPVPDAGLYGRRKLIISQAADAAAVLVRALAERRNQKKIA